MQLNQGAIKGHLARQMCKVTKKTFGDFRLPDATAGLTICTTYNRTLFG